MCKLVHSALRLQALAVLLLAGACNSSPSTPPAPEQSTTETAPAEPAPEPKKDMQPEDKRDIEVEVALIEGKEVEACGIVFVLEGAGYAHMTGDRNLSNAKVIARRDSESKTIHLAREHPGDAEYEKIFDCEIALETADPYHSPNRATARVRPATEAAPAD
jgi:hypothetical protein